MNKRYNKSVLTKLYILVTSLGAESSSVAVNSITFFTWMPLACVKGVGSQQMSTMLVSILLSIASEDSHRSSDVLNSL
jgi:hypothetical protein